MNNLFSIFDPQSSFFFFSLNWVSSVLLLAVLFPGYWLISSFSVISIRWLTTYLSKEMSLNFGSLPSPSFSWYLVSLFLMVSLNNYLGLLPYVFTSSSHLSFSVSFSLVLWVSLISWELTFNFQKLLAHLVPLGTPGALIGLMVLIELMSNMIRPLTLSVRLVANMVAGHLLLCLCSGGISPLTIGSLSIFSGLLMLMILENGVAIIQGYVYSMLPSLYLSESNAPYINN